MGLEGSQLRVGEGNGRTEERERREKGVERKRGKRERREGERERRRERGKKEGRARGRKGGKEGGREGKREGGRAVRRNHYLRAEQDLDFEERVRTDFAVTVDSLRQFLERPFDVESQGQFHHLIHPLYVGQPLGLDVLTLGMGVVSLGKCLQNTAVKVLS